MGKHGTKKKTQFALMNLMGLGFRVYGQTWHPKKNPICFDEFDGLVRV
jgi:hypothetical protein